jgi:hypothetical protein
VLRMLADNHFDFKAGEDLKNSEGKLKINLGNTPLHMACEKPNL